jgi:hypothetical protein
MIYDSIMQSFLRQAYAEGRALSMQSDILTIVNPADDPMPAKLLAYFYGVPHLRRCPDGTVERVAQGNIVVGIAFPCDYLRSTDRWMPLQLISLLAPATFFHPNVKAPVLCPGSQLTPGMSLTALIWHIYDILTYRNMNIDERDALDPDACRYFRQHPEVLAALRPPPLRHRTHLHIATLADAQLAQETDDACL